MSFSVQENNNRCYHVSSDCETPASLLVLAKFEINASVAHFEN
jgi:hypothetical protein